MHVCDTYKITSRLTVTSWIISIYFYAHILTVRSRIKDHIGMRNYVTFLQNKLEQKKIKKERLDSVLFDHPSGHEVASKIVTHRINIQSF